MSVINQTLLLTPEGYQISRSVRLRSSATAYFSRTPASAGNRTTWTWSGWVKRGTLGTTGGTLFGAAYGIYIDSGIVLASDTLGVTFNGNTYNKYTTAVFRDPSAWYHIFVAYDSNNATAANRIRIYVNGVEQTAYTTQNSGLPTLGYTPPCINTANANYVGAVSGYGGTYFDGYMTEVNFIDGQALTPSSFGETNPVTGVWQPKKYAGTYGTNGFYLNFSDPSAATAAAIGKDYSGNGNNWTPNNISVTAGVTYDSMIDVPTMWADGGNGRGNYAVWNPLSLAAASPLTAYQANLTLNSSSTWNTILSSIGVSSGKWYWEITVDAGAGMPSNGSNGTAQFGVATDAVAKTSYLGSTAAGWAYNFDGLKFNGSSSAYGAAFTAGDTVGIALDMDGGTLTFYKNGTTQGQAFSGITGTVFPATSLGKTGITTPTVYLNHGQRPFTYTPPTGFKALNTQNLPEATIKKGNQYFDATLWTGNGGTQSVVNSGAMQPDMAWIKRRESAGNNAVFDSVRGAGNVLVTNSTGAEIGSVFGVSAFNANGFSLGSHPDMNASGGSYVGWQWKESVTSGFDIVTYTGVGGSASFNHSLGVKPAFMIVKGRSNAGNSADVYHKDLGATKGIYLDITNAAATSSAFWNNTEPTSTQFTVGATNNANGTGFTYVAWLWAEVAGFSKFGSYTGNGSADGPFVYCGFRPRYIMVKRTDVIENWYTFDTARETYNQAGNYPLLPNSSVAEPASGTTYSIYLDVLSNGFKLRTTSAGDNASGGTYIFAAFAENPFKNSLAR